jgi:hypothetical protein
MKAIKSLAYHNETIWKILVDTSADCLLVEKRNPQDLQVSFDVLELATGNLLTENLKLWESWWISAVWIHKQKIVFSLYNPTDAPLGTGVMVYDVAQKQILWQNLALNFYGASRQQNCIFLRKNLESTATQAYCLLTGNLLQNSNSEYEENLSGFAMAQAYSAENQFYADLQRFIYQKVQKTTSSPIYYAETPCYIALAYGIEFEEKFAYFLLITDIAGNILSQKQVRSLENSYFCVYCSHLIFVDKNELEIFSLTKTEPYEN